MTLSSDANEQGGPGAAPKYYCTYFDHNYLPQGMAMYRSLLRFCPEAHLFILTLSREAHTTLTAQRLPNITLISMADFEADDPALLVAKGNRSKVEYIFTCTPALCSYVLRRFHEVQLLTYLDADLYFFSDVQPLFDELGTASIGIIPHGYTSSRYLPYGRFNVGWISFRRDDQGLACVAWWRERCLEWCKDLVEPTRYADQKYLDQWPELFGRVHIYTHPGANLARWNIKNREVGRTAGGQLLVDGRPLVFFHFASFRQLTPWLYQPNFATHWVTPSPLVRRHIFGQYIAELRAIAGPVLPLSSRRLKLQDIGLRDLPKLAEQLLRIARSILLLDYVVVGNDARHAAEFAPAIIRPERVGKFYVPEPRGRPIIWFVFADTPGFSGQKESTRLIYENIPAELGHVELIRMPALNRTGHIVNGLLHYVGQTLRAIAAVGEASLSPDPILHVSLGQTKAALLRDAIPLFLIMGLRRKKSAIISLNGSNFMSWSVSSYEARWLRLIMTQAEKLTVVGEGQRRNSIRLGVPAEKLRVVYNTCESDGLGEPQIRDKQQEVETPLRLLHLSSLIDTKGYPAYLEALEELAAMPGRKIEAVLCGRIVISQYGERFRSVAVAETWIRNKIALINQSNRVSVRWLPGATGEDKWLLYREAHVFIFPSLYKVEAQPLVLIEAMAHGCTVVSSIVGEIGSLLDHHSAALLANPDARQIAQAITRLINDPERRAAMALAAKQSFSARFSKKIYMVQWNEMLAALDHIPARS